LKAAMTTDAPTEAAPDLTIVIPTFNERDNLAPLVAKLDVALDGVRWRAIFVDDNSPDGTWREARRLAEVDGRITCIRRVRRRGLAGAVVEGAMASASPIVAVMDADLQHDERLLVPMLEVMRKDEADLVMASRALGDADQAKGLSPFRRRLSRFANRACAWITKRDLIDPLSGFFMIRRDEFDRLAPDLSSAGFKILFDILATARGELRVVEIPYAFGPRTSGESKFDQRVVADYLSLAMSKITRDLISPRAVMFALVGASGLIVHLSVLWLTRRYGFGVGQLLGAVAAMTSNYFLNNALTYRDRSHTGWRLLYGYVKFVALSGLGLAANVGAGSLLNSLGFPWWASGVFGAMVGAVWNYLTTAAAVWN
jgi:dolichol-phosphate mannosyltransferase